MRTTPLCVGIGLLTAALNSLSAQSATPQLYEMTLGNAHVSRMPDAKVVVTMEAKGQLRGLVTLTLNTAGSQITGGEWALVARYVEYLDDLGVLIPEGEEVHVHEGEPHGERPVFIDKGTLSGSVTGGQLGIDGSGAIVSLDSVLLSLESGSLTFTGASGDGSASASAINGTESSTGLLRLTF